MKKIKEALKSCQDLHTHNDFSSWGDREEEMLEAISALIDLAERYLAKEEKCLLGE